MRPRRRGPADDRGETLLELLVALVLLGLVVVVVLSGIGTAALGAATQRTLTIFNTALSSAAGALAADQYVPCADASSYDLGTPPAGEQVSIVAVTYWDGLDSFVATCPHPDNGLQQLSLQVSTAGQHGGPPVRHTRVVIKRDAS